MQYVACKFRSTDTRSYTYEYDGEEPLAIGDFVKVPDRDGDGWKRVEVVSISDQAPSFPCKPILGKVEDDPEAEAPEPSVDTAADVDPLDADMPF